MPVRRFSQVETAPILKDSFWQIKDWSRLAGD
jgi:hypothetical protein